MARDRVKVSIGRTINIGNFEFVRIDVGLEADVRDGETRQKTYETLFKQADKQLETSCAPIEANIDEYNKRRKGK